MSSSPVYEPRWTSMITSVSSPRASTNTSTTPKKKDKQMPVYNFTCHGCNKAYEEFVRKFDESGEYLRELGITTPQGSSHDA